MTSFLFCEIFRLRCCILTSAALKAYINKKYTDDKEAGKVKDNWLEKALKSYDPQICVICKVRVRPQTLCL